MHNRSIYFVFIAIMTMALFSLAIVLSKIETQRPPIVNAYCEATKMPDITTYCAPTIICENTTVNVQQEPVPLFVEEVKIVAQANNWTHGGNYGMIAQTSARNCTEGFRMMVTSLRSVGDMPNGAKAGQTTAVIVIMHG